MKRFILSVLVVIPVMFLISCRNNRYASAAGADIVNHPVEESELQATIDSNARKIADTDQEIRALRQDADDEGRVLEVDPARKERVYTGQKLGNRFRP